MNNVYKVVTIPPPPRFFNSVDDIHVAIPNLSDEILEDLDDLELNNSITITDSGGIQYEVTLTNESSPPGGEGGRRKKSAYKKMHTRKHRGGRRRTTRRHHRYMEAPRSRMVFQMAGRKTRRHRRL